MEAPGQLPSLPSPKSGAGYALEAVRTEPSRTIFHTPMAQYQQHDLGWEALANRRQLSRVILFYKIHQNLVLIPIPDYLN